jgi:hypothetical protein
VLLVYSFIWAGLINTSRRAALLKWSRGSKPKNMLLACPSGAATRDTCALEGRHDVHPLRRRPGLSGGEEDLVLEEWGGSKKDNSGA